MYKSIGEELKTQLEKIKDDASAHQNIIKLMYKLGADLPDGKIAWSAHFAAMQAKKAARLIDTEERRKQVTIDNNTTQHLRHQD